jgi:hypothetical protein
MANETMTLISTVTAASAQAALEFTSIPATSTDLLLVLSIRGSVAAVADEILMTFNNNGSGYSSRELLGSGSAASSNAGSSQAFFPRIWTPLNSATSNTFGSGSIYIPNYAGSTNKTISSDTVTENNATNAYQSIMAGLWANTAAITSIKLNYGSGNVMAGSTASLYGILKGSGGATVA